MAPKATGGLLAAIRAQAEATSRPGPRCTIGKLLLVLPADDAADLQAALDDDNISAAAIAAVLTDRGWPMSHAPVQRHRRRGNGGCSCVDR